VEYFPVALKKRIHPHGAFETVFLEKQSVRRGIVAVRRAMQDVIAEPSRLDGGPGQERRQQDHQEWKARAGENGADFFDPAI